MPLFGKVKIEIGKKMWYNNSASFLLYTLVLCIKDEWSGRDRPQFD